MTEQQTLMEMLEDELYTATVNHTESWYITVTKEMWDEYAASEDFEEPDADFPEEALRLCSEWYFWNYYGTLGSHKFDDTDEEDWTVTVDDHTRGSIY